METQTSPEVQVVLTEDTFSLRKTPTPNPWGIVAGQYREPGNASALDDRNHWENKRLIAAAGWYNKRGEHMGSGDLSFGDVIKFSSEILRGDEILIVLTEGDSFRSFIRGTEEYYRAFFKGNGLCATPPEWSRPGFGYLAERCALLVVQNQICLVEDKVNELCSKLVRGVRIEFSEMRRDEARDAIFRMAQFQK